MGIIESNIRKAFNNFFEGGDVYTFAKEVAHVADYSVSSMTNYHILIESINKIKDERQNHETFSKLTQDKMFVDE